MGDCRSERRGGPARRSTAAGGGAWGLTREDGGADHYCTRSLFKCEALERRGPLSLCDPSMCGKARMLRDSPLLSSEHAMWMGKLIWGTAA